MRGRLMRIAEALAAVGGVLLIGIVLVELASVIGGRFGKPILGDTEIVELACGIAIACFMPYCQMRGANVIVDFFTMKASQRTRDSLDAIMNGTVAVIVLVLTWKLIEGGVDQYQRERISMFLRLPQWIGFAGASVAALAWTAACFYTSYERLRATLGRESA